jgi:hypothetical protein
LDGKVSKQTKEKVIAERRKSFTEESGYLPLAQVAEKVTFTLDDLKSMMSAEDNKVGDAAAAAIFKAYGKDVQERERFEQKLEDIQSHVTRSVSTMNREIRDLKTTTNDLKAMIKHLVAINSGDLKRKED